MRMRLLSLALIGCASTPSDVAQPELAAQLSERGTVGPCEDKIPRDAPFDARLSSSTTQIPRGGVPKTRSIEIVINAEACQADPCEVVPESTFRALWSGLQEAGVQDWTATETQRSPHVGRRRVALSWGREHTCEVADGPTYAASADLSPWTTAIDQGASAFELAVTFDDLPFAGPRPEGGEAQGTVMLLDAVTSRGIPAMGFVNCGRVEDPDTLALWRAAGLGLGNHQQHHEHLDQTDPDLWLQGVRTCHEMLSDPGPEAPFFRYPFLGNGQTVQTRDRVRTAITDMGYTIARVTIDNQEFKYSLWYGKARAAGDDALADELAHAYIEHIRAATDHFRSRAEADHGVEVRQVLLLHANQLNAERVGDLFDALQQDGAKFVPMAYAAADPVYSLPDQYVGPSGISWLYRVNPTEDDGAFLEQAWEAMHAQFDGRIPKVKTELFPGMKPR